MTCTMPALQNEIQALCKLNFRYFACLLDKGHIRNNHSQSSKGLEKRNTGGYHLCV